MVGAGWALKDVRGHGATTAEVEAPAEEAGVVCFGHVDVEPGVARLGSAQPGRVTAVLAQEGQDLQAGAPLLQVDDRHQQAQLRQARAALRGALAQREQARRLIELRATEAKMQQLALEAATNRLANATKQLARCQGDLKGHVAPGMVEDLQDKVRDLGVALKVEETKLHHLTLQQQAAEQELEQAEAAVAGKEEQVAQAERLVEDCVLKAPGAGRVLRVRARLGEVVGPAFPEPLVEFCPDRPRLIRVEVAQEFAGRVRLGAACAAADDYTAADAHWTGRVVRLSDWYSHRRSVLQEPLQFNDVRTLECLIQIDPNQPPLRIGQRMRVTIGPDPAKPQ
jgi:multidrug resistance efflux pump